VTKSKVEKIEGFLCREKVFKNIRDFEDLKDLKISTGWTEFMTGKGLEIGLILEKGANVKSHDIHSLIN